MKKAGKRIMMVFQLIALLALVSDQDATAMGARGDSIDLQGNWRYKRTKLLLSNT